MRHYFGYDQAGELVSTEMMTGGFPDECAMHLEDCTHPVVSHVKGIRSKANPEVIGFIPFDCSCTVNTCGCKCVNRMRRNGRVKDGILYEKPHVTLLVNNIAVTVPPEKQPIIQQPAAVISVQLGAPPEAEGTAITVIKGSGHALLSLELPLSLIVTNGKTAPFNLTMPAQGIGGSIHASGPWIAPTHIAFLAFAK